MTCTICGTANPEGMHFCGMCGSQLEQRLGVRERRRVSVVFVDPAAFSTLTRDFDPEELRDLADEVLTVVAGIIENYGGYVDAFRGDGLIALFGAPHSHPDDLQRAVLAAAAGLQAIERIGASTNYPLKGRAGVNAGIVIAGSVGSGRVRDYTVMGSAVNLAARLEAAAPPGDVWVGGETQEATRHQLGYQRIASVELPGFPNVREAYWLVSVSERVEDDPYAHLTFVGRESEIASLARRFDGVVLSGRAQELWLLGEAGSGKTRLLRKFFARPEQGQARVLWIEGRPTEQYSWDPLAQQLFGLQEGEDAAVRRHRMTTQLTELLPDEPRWQGLILASLKMVEQKPWTRLERRNVNRTSLAWCDLVIALSRKQGNPQPVVLVVENEPQDPPLLEFLRLLRQAQAPILVIRTCRGRNLPAERETITLNPLGVPESLTLLNQLASPVLKVAAESLVYQVGGIPAYILELGQALSITPEVPFSGSLASLLQAGQARHDRTEGTPTPVTCGAGR